MTFVDPDSNKRNRHINSIPTSYFSFANCRSLVRYTRHYQIAVFQTLHNGSNKIARTRCVRVATTTTAVVGTRTL